ncbi:hypothetical protein AB1303_14765 [Saccharolobus solfataricus]|nr:hypothetical protein [Saccharolobus solfataricus]
MISESLHKFYYTIEVFGENGIGGIETKFEMIGIFAKTPTIK